MVGIGTPRDVARESRPKCENLKLVPEDIARKSEEIVRAQSGSNRFASQVQFFYSSDKIKGV